MCEESANQKFKEMTGCLSAGDDILSAHSSPLLVNLLDAAIRQVNIKVCLLVFMAINITQF